MKANTQTNPRGVLLHIERILWCAGFVFVSLCACVGFQAHAAKRALWIVPRQAATLSASAHPQMTEVMGQLSIPSLSLSVPILSDYDPASLLRGVGHIQGTAMPGGLGNMALAGHRDTYFRPLRRISRGMLLKVEDADGLYSYAVDSTEIVTPEQVSVLEIRDQPELTLITCYPFDYVGAAPRRFIVHAHLLSAAAEHAARQ